MMTKLNDFIIINKASRIDKTLQRKNDSIICTHTQQISDASRRLETYTSEMQPNHHGKNIQHIQIYTILNHKKQSFKYHNYPLQYIIFLLIYSFFHTK